VTLRGAVDAFPLETVIQLLGATGKSGELLVRGEERSGSLGMSGGRLVSARSDESDGPLALGALFTIVRGNFEFVPRDEVAGTDLEGELLELLERAAEERDRILQIREVVPSDRSRFRLSERAAEQGEITLTPTQWRTLLAVDGQRDVAGVAERTQTDRLSAASVLAGLARAGLIEPADAGAAPLERESGYHRLPPVQSIPPTRDGERIVLRGRVADYPIETVLELLADTGKTGRLEILRGPDARVLRLREGRLVSAQWEEEEGELALGAAFTATEGEFDFVPMPEVTQSDLSGSLDELLDRAAGVRDRILAIQAAIPDERSRFVLSDRATRQPEIVLTPDQWRVVLAVNGERDVAETADQLRMRRLPVKMLLADLVRDGFVDMIAPPSMPTWPEVDRRQAAWSPSAPPEPEAAPTEPEPVEPGLTWADAEPVAVEPEPAPAEPEPEPSEPPPPASWAITSEELAPETAPPEPPAAEVEQPLEEAPLDREPVMDDRLAALSGLFGPAEPAPPPPAWEPPPPEAAPAERAAAEATAEAFAAPAARAVADTAVSPLPPDTRPVPAAKPKRGLFGLFGKEEPTPPIAPAVARSHAGQLALLANELVAAYNSGQYGKGRVEDRMSGRLMRVDEQADPIDRPVPLSEGRIDVVGVEGLPERQSVPYLALLVRQIYDDAEQVHGKDKARRGFRDVRDRLFGRDDSLLRSPEVAGRMPRA